MSVLRVRDIGEQGLLQRLYRFCPAEVVGDDAAVVPAPASGHSLVVTTDVLVEGVHFSDRTTSPADAGWRAVAANLSDLAAMGASPLGLTVGLGLTGDVEVSWIEQLYQGMSQCLHHYTTPLVGGDICRSPVVSIAITAFGQVLPQRTIRRSSAQLGDAIVVTGVHGASRAGLELLLNRSLGNSVNDTDYQALITAHQRPKPRLDVLPILWQILDRPDQPEYASCPIAGMDSSDGLADAIVQLCHGSEVGAVLERHHIPLPPALQTLVSPEQAWQWVLYGGEDFELVLCLRQEMAERVVEQLGATAAIIGQITTGNEVWLKDSRGTFADEILSLNQGFQHF